jgi:DNA modification methylase
MIHYRDDWLTVYLGDCRTELQALEPESVHCVVTSPPYWGLRDYGTASWEGGDAECDHKAPSRFDYPLNAGLGPTGVQTQASNAASDQGAQFRSVCGKCGARRIDSQLGLEPTPDAYIEAMVGVFREVKRVLRRDGTCWVNMGDGYAGGGGFAPNAPSNIARAEGGAGVYDGLHWTPRIADRQPAGKPDGIRTPGLKPKDLIGMPWRLAFALQADGWYLRSDIIWAKPNPMPESVTDRPTKSHEYLFLLTRSARYYYDADAVRESAEYGRREWSDGRAEYDFLGTERTVHSVTGSDPPAGRNLRSVWTIATQPYPGAHFATFPEALVEPCVKAGTSERGVCPECGAPWVREVERNEAANERNERITTASSTGFAAGAGHIEGSSSDRVRSLDGKNYVHVRGATTGWAPDCDHRDSYTGLHEPPIPATVLDPFAGSGTTARVANRLSRRAILIDLSADYLDQAMLRNAQPPLGLGA